MDTFVGGRLAAGAISRLAALAVAVPIAFGALAVSAADLTVKEVTEALVRATPGHPADLSNRNLAGLDLSGLDFSGARLAHADLTAADLSDANLSASDLRGARLDLAVVLRANFNDADLSGASLVRMAVSSGMEAQASEAPSFVRANLTGARIFARLSLADLRQARLVHAHLDVDARTPKTMNLTRMDLSGSNLSGADLAGADLRRALLSFADLSGADLTGANLDGADLTGADLAKANLTDAHLDGTVLERVRGSKLAIGLERMQGRDKTVR